MSTTPTVPAPKPAKTASPMPVWVVVIIFLAGIMLGGIVFASVWMIMNRPAPQQANKPPVEKVSDIVGASTPATTTLPTDQTVPSSTDAALPSTEELSYDATPDNSKLTLDVTWKKPVMLGINKALGSVVEANKEKYGTEKYSDMLSWIAKQDAEESEWPTKDAIGTWLIGSVKSGKYQSSAVYYRRPPECARNETNCYPYHFLVSADGKEARLLDSLYIEPVMGDPYDVSTPEDRSLFIKAFGLALPKGIEDKLYAADGHELQYADEDGFFSVGNQAALYTEWLANGSITSLKNIGKTKDGRVVYGDLSSGTAYVQEDSGWPVRVASTMDTTGIVWDKVALGNKKPAADYSPPKGGCGESFWITSPDDSDDMSDAALTIVGKTKDGDNVYAPKDPSKSESVRLAYDGWYVPDTEKKQDFAGFLMKKPVPVIFWKDAFGRWAKYMDTDIQPMAECGKPVIYLYPTKTTAVSVKLPSFIKVTVSEPAYPSTGWKAVAQPNGQLTMADGQTYGSLYWEGLGVGYQTPKQGFLVKDGDQKKFLSDILPKYGLNSVESKEFMDFWLPQMVGAPYYRVSFLTDEWSKAAPLYVNPKPDSSIRIFMDWQKLSAPKALSAPAVVTPERNGFTLVEWGGLLYK